MDSIGRIPEPMYICCLELCAPQTSGRAPPERMHYLRLRPCAEGFWWCLAPVKGKCLEPAQAILEYALIGGEIGCTHHQHAGTCSPHWRSAAGCGHLGGSGGACHWGTSPPFAHLQKSAPASHLHAVSPAGAHSCVGSMEFWCWSLTIRRTSGFVYCKTHKQGPWYHLALSEPKVLCSRYQEFLSLC